MFLEVFQKLHGGFEDPPCDACFLNPIFWVLLWITWWLCSICQATQTRLANFLISYGFRDVWKAW